MLMVVLRFLLCWAAAALLLVSLPFVFGALFDEDDVPRQDEAFWLERGYPPLEASSLGVPAEE